MPAMERHDATWIAWPHHEAGLAGQTGANPLGVRPEIVRALSEYERVEILCHDARSPTMLVRSWMRTA